MGASLDVMTDAEKAAAYDAMQSEKAQAKKSGPDRYRVVESLRRGGGADRTFFSSVSKKRAQKYIEDHCPRGSHFHLLNPDGSLESYEAERLTGGPKGEEYDTAWAPFDRDAYQAPELAPVNTNDPWADAWEGAQ